MAAFTVIFFQFHSSSVSKIKDQAVDQLTKFKDKVVNMTMSDSRDLENLFKAKHKPHYDGKTIFFLETHLDKNWKEINMNARQACSIEAAGKFKILDRFHKF